MFFDEYGRPFIVLREQNNKDRERAKGIDAIKVCMRAAYRPRLAATRH